MKRSKVLFAFVLVSIAVGCSEVESTDSQCGDLTFELSLEGGGTDSRVAVSEDPQSEKWLVEWSEGDALGGYSTAGELCFTPFSMVNFDSESSTFSGSVQGEQMRLLYPYDELGEIDNGLYRVDLTSQSVDMDSPFSLMGQNTYMINSEMISMDSTTPIVMRHVGAALTLKLGFTSLSEDYTYTLSRVALGADEESLDSGDVQPILTQDINLTLPIDDSAFYTNPTYGSLELDVVNSPTIYNYSSQEASTIYSLNFNILPMEILAGESIDVIWYLYRTSIEGGKVNEIFNSVTISNTLDRTINFERATRNEISAICDISGCYIHITVDVGFD